MPWEEILGTGIVAAATFAFNPIPQFIGNPMFAAIATAAAGFALVHFFGGNKWIKIVGAGVSVAGVIALVQTFLSGQGQGR